MTRVTPELVAHELLGVQPLSSPIKTIYYKKAYRDDRNPELIKMENSLWDYEQGLRKFEDKLSPVAVRKLKARIQGLRTAIKWHYRDHPEDYV